MRNKHLWMILNVSGEKIEGCVVYLTKGSSTNKPINVSNPLKTSSFHRLICKQEQDQEVESKRDLKRTTIYFQLEVDLSLIQV